MIFAHEPLADLKIGRTWTEESGLTYITQTFVGLYTEKLFEEAFLFLGYKPDLFSKFKEMRILPWRSNKIKLILDLDYITLMEANCDYLIKTKEFGYIFYPAKIDEKEIILKFKLSHNDLSLILCKLEKH